MKNVINYYAAIFLPLVTMVLLSANGLLSNSLFFILIMVYALFYHPFISGRRLIELGKIDKKDFIYNFIPGWNIRYFSELFFNR